MIKKSKELNKLIVIVTGALLLSLTMAGQVSALEINFIETGATVNAYVDSVLTDSGTHTAHVTVPFVTALSGMGFKFYSDMVDFLGGSVKDRVLISLLATTADITFASDPLTLDITGAQPFFAGSNAVVEDGTLQLLFQMQSTGGASSYTMFVNGQSAVPEPATMLLLGFGLIGLAGCAIRSKK